ncbi:MAG: Methylated-DNA--protein-cysteine methyltransferase [bacterium ADurb.Bin243]|nr:MAG: Methylated-DNA--protein-cysteine methyltransferase [bacterium ADurb.Bin243]
MYYITNYTSPVGQLTLASDGDNLTGLWLDGQKYFCATVDGCMRPENNMSIFDAAKEWLDGYFAGEKPALSELSLAPAGGDFRQEVWKLLREIPYGMVTTYGEIAKKIAVKMHKKSVSAQAVGGAVGHNPISIIIPCHRVLGGNGSLTGYAGGVQVKLKLLELEGMDTASIFVPTKGTAL